MFNISLKFSDKGSAALSSIIRTRLLDFLGEKDLNVFGRIHFIGSDVKPCGDAHKKVKYQPGLRNPGNHKGIPVSIWTEGRQGVRGFLWCEHAAAYPSFGSLVKSSKKKNHDDLNGKVVKLAPPQTLAVLSPPDSEQAVMFAAAKVEPPSLPSLDSLRPKVAPKKVSPLEKLISSGVSFGEIARLKKTLASIIFRVHGKCEEIPCTLCVPVSVISEAVKKHMNLAKDSHGQDRGPVANFYAARMVLFGVKYRDEQSREKKARYHDWLFDCDSILGFIGGQEMLKTLLLSEGSLQVRTGSSTGDIENIPPSAALTESVDNVEKNNSPADEDVLRMALESVAAYKKAVAFLEETRNIETKLLMNIEALKSNLSSLEQELVATKASRESAEASVANLGLSEDELIKVRAAKARLKMLLDGADL